MKFVYVVLNLFVYNGKWGRNKMGANIVYIRLRFCFFLSVLFLVFFRRLVSKSFLIYFCLLFKCSLFITVFDWLFLEFDLWDLEGFDWSVVIVVVFWLVDLDVEFGIVVRGIGGFIKGLESFFNCNSKNLVLICVLFIWLFVWVLF